MDDFYFYTCHINNEDSAYEHFATYCSNPSVWSGERKKFEYETKICWLGSSLVSSSMSDTGWGYETKCESDGFLLTIPQSGFVTWRGSNQIFSSKLGSIFLADQREISTSSYSQNARYTSIYLCHADIIRYLTVLNGELAKPRIYFTKRTADKWAGIFLTNLVEAILCLSSNTTGSRGEIFKHLKESLICFILYNIENNYSETLKSTKNIANPTPYSIKKTADYIHFNSEKTLVLSDLATYAGISIRSLQLGFKQFKGTTPMNYLRKIRLTRARAMLTDQNSELKPCEVAIQCGFTNYYLFAKYYSLEFYERPVKTVKKRPPL